MSVTERPHQEQQLTRSSSDTEIQQLLDQREYQQDREKEAYRLSVLLELRSLESWQLEILTQEATLQLLQSRIGDLPV